MVGRIDGGGIHDFANYDPVIGYKTWHSLKV